MPPSQMRFRHLATHNLKIEELDLPQKALIVITGPSGSGKSSLALDTIGVEGQRRYLSALALSQEVRIPPPPDLKEASEIPPTVILPQRVPPPNPRSTVGTVSGLLEVLRGLFSELGEIPCRGCGRLLRISTISELLAFFEELPSGTKLVVLAPLSDPSPGGLSYLLAEGFGRFVIDGKELDLTEEPLPEEFQSAEVVIDRLIKKGGGEVRFLEALRLAESLSGGPVKIKVLSGTEYRFSLKNRCPYCLSEVPGLSPEDFSFNHPRGACPQCKGLGEKDGAPCGECGGLRLRREGLAVCFGGKRVSEILKLPLGELYEFLKGLTLAGLAERLFRPFKERALPLLHTLVELGLGSLNLLSPFHQLSTGERKRVEIAGLLSAGLSGCVFVLDEPGLGLSPQEKEKLLIFLKKLVFSGNTVILVEHDPFFIKSADLVVELGPGAGEQGGRLLFVGSPEELSLRTDLPTGAFLSGARRLRRRTLFPKEGLTVLCGPSGSGKTRYLQRLAEELSAEGRSVLFVCGEIPGKSKGLVASFIGIFNEIRRLFAETPEARALNLSPGHFSPFSPEGRCPLCRGEGRRALRISGLPETEILCEECGGTGLKPEVLKVTYRGLTLPEVLGLTVKEALHLFSRLPRINQTLLFLSENGLSYLRLGQPLRTLSGGEKLRLRLFRELSARRSAEFILLDLPSMGLHFTDLERLLALFEKLLAEGKKLLLAENHPALILLADEVWLVEDARPVFRGKPRELLALDHPFVGGLEKYLSLVEMS